MKKTGYYFKWFLYIIVGLVVTFLIYISLFWVLISVVSIIIILYTVSLLFKTLIFTTKGSLENTVVKMIKEPPQENKSLPLVTILLPLYKEITVVNTLINNIQMQNYPKNRLDVKLLLERDDVETIKQVSSIKLPFYFETLILDSVPKTKPAALQVGLSKAKGDILVVYDAEDNPERNQVIKAAMAFLSLEKNIACLQATLRLRSAKGNLLAKFFSAEYSNHFGLYLPFFVKADLVIPLGGTSNFFRVNVLKELGGWDPNNVTEDADLGVRLARAGYKVKMLNSETTEEPNTNLKNWIRQRSRWIKGYLQTWMKHTKPPNKLYKEVGLNRFLAFHIVFGLGPIFSLVNPIFWFMTFWYLIARPIFIESLFPVPLFYLALVSTLGNIVFIIIAMSACMKEGEYDKVVWMLLAPFYWFLISIGAWYGFYQLLTNPTYWEKTEHGLSPTSFSEESATIVTSNFRK